MTTKAKVGAVIVVGGIVAAVLWYRRNRQPSGTAFISSYVKVEQNGESYCTRRDLLSDGTVQVVRVADAYCYETGSDLLNPVNWK